MRLTMPRPLARLLLAGATRLENWLWDHEQESDAEELSEWIGAHRYVWLGAGRTPSRREFEQLSRMYRR